MAEAEEPQAHDPYEAERQQAELNRNLHAADIKSAWWRDLLLNANTLDLGYLRSVGATPLLLAKLLKLISDADLLLCRVTGMTALRVVVQFDPATARKQAEGPSIDGGGFAPRDHTARQALRDALADVPDLAITTIQPHYPLVILARHCDGQIFTPDEYGDILRKLVRVPTAVLLYRLGLIRERPKILQGPEAHPETGAPIPPGPLGF